MKQDIKLFDTKKIRAAWNELKTKLNDEGNQLSQFLGQLKLKSNDGTSYLTDVANTQPILRYFPHGRNAVFAGRNLRHQIIVSIIHY